MSITITLDTPYMNETVWDLDGYVTNLRGAALKQAAADLGIKLPSKAKVDEYREAITEHYTNAYRAKLDQELAEDEAAGHFRTVKFDVESGLEPISIPQVTALTGWQRVDNYAKQSPKLTARQKRRITKKANHAAKHGRAVKVRG